MWQEYEKIWKKINELKIKVTHHKFQVPELKNKTQAFIFSSNTEHDMVESSISDI